MSEYSQFVHDLSTTSLFASINQGEIPTLLKCVHAKCVKYKKGDLIIEAESRVTDFGIMLSGAGRSVKWDASGRLIIITLLGKGSVVGVMLAATAGQGSPLTVEATEDSTVIQIPFNRIITRCEKSCLHHETLLRNYVGVVAEKGLELHERVNCLLEPTIRDKVMTYLTWVSRQKNSLDFTIPINRNIMAEYLNIERSALSRELSNMKKDGLIDYQRNRFTIFT